MNSLVHVHVTLLSEELATAGHRAAELGRGLVLNLSLGIRLLLGGVIFLFAMTID